MTSSWNYELALPASHEVWRFLFVMVPMLSFEKNTLEMSSAKSLPFHSARNALTHWGRDKMAAIFQTTFSNGFSWMKMYEFRLTFHWSLFQKGPINNIPTLVQITVWRRSGDKPLSEPMMVSLLTHICVTRPQLIKCKSATYMTTAWRFWLNGVLLFLCMCRTVHVFNVFDC